MIGEKVDYDVFSRTYLNTNFNKNTSNFFVDTL
jgi:hypothetical protein